MSAIWSKKSSLNWSFGTISPVFWCSNWFWIYWILWSSTRMPWEWIVCLNFLRSILSSAFLRLSKRALKACSLACLKPFWSRFDGIELLDGFDDPPVLLVSYLYISSTEGESISLEPCSRFFSILTFSKANQFNRFFLKFG